MLDNNMEGPHNIIQIMFAPLNLKHITLSQDASNEYSDLFTKLRKTLSPHQKLSEKKRYYKYRLHLKQASSKPVSKLNQIPNVCLLL